MHRSAKERTRSVGSVIAVAAVAVAVPLAVPATPATAVRATPAAAVRATPVHVQPARAGSVWATGEWTSGTGNTVADVATTIGARSTATRGLTGAGVGIALIDTGVVPAAGLPAAQIVNGPDLSFESQSDGLRYLDTYGHGTHLAGIIVGNDPTTGLRGIAPGAKLTSVKVGTANGTVDVSQVIAALDWVVAHRNDDKKNPIKVICLAYGTDAAADRASDPLLRAVENADMAGITVVVAGGNTGTALGRVASPALDRFVLTVGSAATQGTPSQSDDTVSTFSSVDPTTPLDIVAPGESIVSVRDEGGYIDTTYPNARVGTSLIRGSGSSQAAAVTAGAVALLLQKKSNVPPHLMREWIRNGAIPIAGATTVTPGELNVANTLLTPNDTWKQDLTHDSTGSGSIEAARGSSHVVDSNSLLQGESSIFGPFDAAAWSTASSNGTAWHGGLWMGVRLAGDGWTGTSWASKTWAPATWSGVSWAGQAWTDAAWNGHYWSGHYWSSTDWSGHYWSASTWEAKTWTGCAWASAGWG